jgi:hypothetical protein|tara:strand:+ start:108 stop:356 length:249 start_codon:yes stop_codon:yes gene_type:complete
MQVKCKIQEWQIQLKQRDCRISILKDGEELKSIKTRLFKERGMKMFPQELYKLICQDLTAANIYDKFLDKYYTWDENDDECL